MRFDAYAGNVYGAGAEEVATMVAHAAAGRVERGRPRRRYSDVYEVKDGNALVGWVGLDGQLQAAYFEAKGETTPLVSGAIRKHWPSDHTVSRLDSCEDFNEEGTYGRLVGLVDAACDPRVQSDQIAPRNGDRGVTTYWGARTSRVLVRVYEAGKMKDRLHLCKPHWVRAEVQVRPGKSVEKRQAATVSPVDAWGFAAWSKRAAETLAGIEVQRFAPPSESPEFDRTTLYLARAFRRHWQELLAERGDWLCVGRELEEIWRQDDEAEALQRSR